MDTSCPSDDGDTKVKSLDIVEYRNSIYDVLIRSGEINMVKSHFSDILKFSGWSAKIRDKCTQYIKKEGIQNVNFSHMICDMTPYARTQVPPDIRQSMEAILYSVALTSIRKGLLKVPDKDRGEVSMVTSDTYLPFEYQSRDKVPDYGDCSVFTQQPDLTILSPSLHSPSVSSPTPSITEQNYTTSAGSPTNLCREMGGIVLLDRVDPDKEKEKEKELLKEREKQERERIRQDAEKERQEKERERKDREIQEREREKPELQKEQRRNHPQSLSVPSSPSTPRQEKKGSLTEAVVLQKLTQTKPPPPPLTSALITSTGIAGKKPKQALIFNSSDEDENEDEELMDI